MAISGIRNHVRGNTKSLQQHDMYALIELNYLKQKKQLGEKLVGITNDAKKSMSNAKSKVLNIKAKVTDKADKAKKSIDIQLEEFLKIFVELIAKWREFKASLQNEATQIEIKLENYKTESSKFFENFKTKVGKDLSEVHNKLKDAKTKIETAVNEATNLVKDATKKIVPKDEPHVSLSIR